MTVQGPNNFSAALAAGAATAGPHKRNERSTEIFVVPKEFKLETIACSDESVQERHSTDSLGEFIAYVEKFGNKHSVIAENLPQSAVAHLDYHEPVKDAPAKTRPNRHVLTLTREHDRDFAAWLAFIGTPGQKEHRISQREFVEFIDEHIGDVFKPSGAELLDILENVEGRSEVRFNSVASAQGGTKVTYSSVDEAKAGESGSAVIPKEIQIRLPLFKHGAPHELRIRVRCRIAQGELVFAPAWLNLNDALDHEEESVRANLQGSLGKRFFVFRGK